MRTHLDSQTRSQIHLLSLSSLLAYLQGSQNMTSSNIHYFSMIVGVMFLSLLNLAPKETWFDILLNGHSCSNTVQTQLVKNYSNVNRSNLEKVLHRSHLLANKYSKFGLPEISPGDSTEHYKLTRFQLSPGRNATVSFSFINAKNSSRHLVGMDDCIDRVICKIDEKAKPLMRHFAHFAQHSLPCFSGLLHAMEFLEEEAKLNQQMANGTQFVLETLGAEQGAQWKTDLVEYIAKVGISVRGGQRSAYSKCDWLIQVKQNPHSSGWQGETGKVNPRSKSIPMKRYPLNNPAYFESQRHMAHLQRVILGDSLFQHCPSQEVPIRVLIIDRENQTRHWKFSKQTKDLLESDWSTELLAVELIHNPSGDLYNQALMFHSADIIISPHGAQLTNLAFIHPCTAVVELFPISYYLSFYQPYVLAAEGISYEAYPFDATPLLDTVRTTKDGRFRGESRGGPMLASQDSIVHQFPTVVSDVISCREKWRRVSSKEMSYVSKTGSLSKLE